ncbi:putative nuclease HARBI1 [Tanacetum coccineum]
MNCDRFFFDDTDDEEEVNSLVFEYFKDVSLLFQASTSAISKITRNPIDRDCHDAHDCLVAAYFAEQPSYTTKQFRKRFRMRRKLFTRIVRELTNNYPYFQQTHDAVGKCGISSLVKCTSVIRQLTYDAIADSLDEYLQIDDKTARDCLVAFCNKFPGMLGSIDCTKRSWAQCLVGLRAQFWSNNDINIICQLPLLNNLKVWIAPEVPFVAHNVNYRWGYYHTDEIYPEWTLFVKSIS